MNLRLIIPRANKKIRLNPQTKRLKIPLTKIVMIPLTKMAMIPLTKIPTNLLTRILKTLRLLSHYHKL